jgi:ParB-like chromosome segregation protein Spo0J
VRDILKNMFEKCETLDEKVTLLNQIREALVEFSPLEEPVDCVRWVKSANIRANEYNPNVVASPEMKLLYESIKSDGYTQPIVVYSLGDGNYEIVDGFHRSRVGKEYKDIAERVHGYLPVVVINKQLDERMGSTIRHNRARGTHQIRSMSDIVIQLVKLGWDDDKICEKLGMDRTEVFKLKQASGMKEAFVNHEFSKSWTDFERKYFQDEIGNTNKTISKKPLRKTSDSGGSGL